MKSVKRDRAAPLEHPRPNLLSPLSAGAAKPPVTADDAVFKMERDLANKEREDTLKVKNKQAEVPRKQYQQDQQSRQKPETYGKQLDAQRSHWHKLAPKMPAFDPATLVHDSSSESMESDEPDREKVQHESQVSYFLCGSFTYWWPQRMISEAEIEQRVMSAGEDVSAPAMSGMASPLGGRSRLAALKAEIEAQVTTPNLAIVEQSPE